MAARQGDASRAPGSLDIRRQSAVGFKPASTSTAQDGDTFLIGRVTHYNNPVTSDGAKHYSGNITFRLGGFTSSTAEQFPWTLWETPNLRPNDPRCAFPTGPSNVNNQGCADEIKFTSQISNQVFDQAGFEYKLVVSGFIPTSAATCPATPPPGAATNRFLTRERSTSAACLYASLVQLRQLTVVKRVVAAPTTAPSFGFTGTSSLDGSPWAARKFDLDPSNAGNGETAQLLRGETVSVTETPQTGDQWSTTGIACVDGDGGTVAGVTYDVGAGSVRLSNVPPPPTTTAAPITCTFTNTYGPKATLTLVKQVTGGSATPAQFTLNAKGPASIGGPGNSPQVSNQRVPVGTYALSETGPPGYTEGPWTCTGGDPAVGESITLTDNQNVRCTVTNTLANAAFSITKAVDGPAGGFIGSAATAFTGTYSCGTEAPQPFSVSTGTPFVSPPQTIGAVCTVTETPPTGNLADVSYRWLAPLYSNRGRVTVAAGGTASLAITNRYERQAGSIEISKAVVPRAGTPTTGYTGGPARAFPVTYTCTLGAATVATATADVTTATPLRVNDLPAGASCSFSETLTAAVGDFADASYAWDGNTFAPISLTVPDAGVARTTVTNFFARGSATLRVTKAVDGGGYIGTGTPFRVTYDCGGGNSGTLELGNNGEATATVPANTQCRVTETAPSEDLLSAGFDWGSATYTGLTNGAVTVASGATATVGVTNPTVPIYGRLTVSKAVTPAALAGALLADARFSITVSCSAPAQGAGANYTNTFSVAAGATATTPNLPLGTSCEVTEAAPSNDAFTGPSYSWGTTPAAQTVTVSERNAAVTATVTNTLNRELGSFNIAKAVNGLGGVEGQDTTFSGTWECRAGSSVLNGTWSRTGAGAATETGPNTAIPLGSVCTVVETAPTGQPSPGDPSFIWSGIVLPDPITVTAANRNPVATVTNVITQLAGGFLVAKVVEGGAAGEAYPDTDFTFSYSCTGGGTTITGTLTMQAGASATTGNTPIPAGSRCTVTEGERPGALLPYAWTDTVGFQVNGGVDVDADDTSVSFTTPEEGTAVSISATNRLQIRSATVAVTKLVPDPPAGFDGSVEFPVGLDCTDGAYGPVVIGAGETATFEVSLGATCEAVEFFFDPELGLPDASYAWGDPTITPAEIEVTDEEGDYEFTVTNPIVRQREPIGLVKFFDDGGYAGVVDPTFAYSGDWSCQYEDDTPVTGTWTVDGEGEATLTGVPAGGILIGSVCTPDENPLPAPSSDPSYFWQAPEYDPVTIEEGGIALMDVINTLDRRVGSLTATKTLTGATGGYTGTGPQFQVDATCNFPGNLGGGISGGVRLTPGAPAETVIAEVPLGWTCTVAEVPPQAPLRDPSYAWGTPTVAPASVEIAEEDTAVEVSMTNTIERRTGRFAVEKIIETFGEEPNPVLPTAEFTGTYRCVYGAGEPFEQEYVGLWSITGEGVATLTQPDRDYPVTTVCTATENAPTGGLQPGFAWTDPLIEPTAGVTITGGGTVPDIDVTNFVQRIYGALRLTKTYTGVTGAFPAGTTVTGSWECTDAQGNEYDATWEVAAAGQTIDLFTPDGDEQVPVGSVCSIAEDTLDDGDLTDESFTWNDPTYGPNVTLTEGVTPVLEVINSTRRVFGSFAVRKAIEGPEGVRTDVEFTGTWSCRYGADGPAKDGQWTITDEGVFIVPGILVNSTCTADENQPTVSAVPTDVSYIWGLPVITDSGPVRRDGQESAEVIVTNPIERVLTSIDLLKSLDSPGNLPDGLRFSVDYRCVAQNGDEFTGSARLAPNTVFVSPEVIPAGSVCAVTEEALPDVADRYRWRTVGFTASGTAFDTPVTTDGQTVTFTVPAPNPDLLPADVQIEVVNTLERAPGIPPTIPPYVPPTTVIPPLPNTGAPAGLLAALVGGLLALGCGVGLLTYRFTSPTSGRR